MKWLFNGKKLFITKNLVYILLNKPKDYITQQMIRRTGKRFCNSLKMQQTNAFTPLAGWTEILQVFCCLPMMATYTELNSSEFQYKKSI